MISLKSIKTPKTISQSSTTKKMEIGLRKGQLRQGNKFLVQTKDKEFVEVFLFDICTPIGEEDIFVWHRHMTKEEFDKIREKPVKKTG